MRRLTAAFAMLLCSTALSIPAAEAAPNCTGVNPGGGEEQFQVFFNTGSAAFDAPAQRELARAASRIRGTFANEVCLVGRASRVGNVQANQRLSAQRVAAVRSDLIRRGVNASALGSVPQGATFERAFGGQNSRDERSVSIVIRQGGTTGQAGSSSQQR